MASRSKFCRKSHVHPKGPRWGSARLRYHTPSVAMIANLQYGWTLFVSPIDQKYHWGRAAIQVAFTIFVLTETWLVPIEGYLIDKFGPRVDDQRQRRTGRDRLGHQLGRGSLFLALSRALRSAVSAPA